MTTKIMMMSVAMYNWKNNEGVSICETSISPCAELSDDVGTPSADLTVCFLWALHLHILPGKISRHRIFAGKETLKRRQLSLNPNSESSLSGSLLSSVIP